MNKQEALKLAEALTDLIDGWNDAGEKPDRGRPNNALCLILWDDGSGRIGTYMHPVAFCENPGIHNLSYNDVINTHCQFKDCDELAAFLASQCDES